MTKRIELMCPPGQNATTNFWRATSRRFGVTAYGRSISEAKQRLFVTVQVEKSNRGAFYAGLIIPIARDWDKRLT